MGVSSEYYKKYHDIIHKHMEERGEGGTKASQIVTAINRLLYGWYNDGDVYNATDKDEEWSRNWSNDLSHYANWLYEYTDLADILDGIFSLTCNSKDAYEELLKKLADKALTEEYLSPYATQNKEDSIYNERKGPFECIAFYNEDEDEDEDS